MIAVSTLLAYLNTCLTEHRCNGTFTHLRQFCLDKDCDVDIVQAGLERYGNCDCEILANTPESVYVQELPPIYTHGASQRYKSFWKIAARDAELESAIQEPTHIPNSWWTAYKDGFVAINPLTLEIVDSVMSVM